MQTGIIRRQTNPGNVPHQTRPQTEALGVLTGPEAHPESGNPSPAPPQPQQRDVSSCPTTTHPAAKPHCNQMTATRGEETIARPFYFRRIKPGLGREESHGGFYLCVINYLWNITAVKGTNGLKAVLVNFGSWIFWASDNPSQRSVPLEKDCHGNTTI